MDFCFVQNIETKKRLKRFNPRSSDEVRNLPKIAKFSESIEKHVLEIRTFSKERLYKHKRIENMGEEAASVIKRLFKFFLNQFDMVPSSFKTSSNSSKERIISDYIAGMTDRFALQLINDLNSLPKQNAHPNFDHADRIALFHNGNIANYSDLRASLDIMGIKLCQNQNPNDITDS